MTSKIVLHPGDNRVSLAAMADNSVDSVVCDPPYGLVSVQKRFGKDGSAPARTDTNDGSFNRLSKGFMGKTWDGTGIENDPSFWAEVLRVLKPGGYIVAFSSSRTFHRMTCAIEDAGFIIHPLIGWLNGQGFPKAHAADKAIGKMLGKAGEIVASGAPVKRMIPGADQNKAGWEKNNGREYQPAADEAAEWQGWAYGGQVRKPALEPICVAQKPFSEKSGAANILKWGVGAVNIDGCRVPTAGEVITTHSRGGSTASPSRPTERTVEESGRSTRQDLINPNPREGRHPANIIHDGSDEVIALFPDSKGQNGDLKSHGNTRQSPNGIFGGMRPALDHPKRNDSGSAARFFESYPFEDHPTFYHPKAGKDDRAGSKHPTVKPIALMAALVRHVTPPGGTVLDPFAGSGTTGEAARREGFNCILMEAEPEYLRFLEKRFGLGADERDPFDDLLGGSTKSTTDHIFGDLL